MAISKEQPMRSALISVIDALGEDFPGDIPLTNVLGALSSAIQSISDELGGGFSSDNTVADAVAPLANIRIGMTSAVVVGGGSSQATSHVFAQPFADGSKCVVLGGVVSDELLSLFTLDIIECTYSGFSFSVSNSDEDMHSVNVGYIAIKVG